MVLQDIQKEAQKEMERMKKIFSELQILKKEKSEEFYNFAQNYFKDGVYFFKKEDYLRAFEAFIISWAYLDIGLKLKLFKIEDISNFTV